LNFGRFGADEADYPRSHHDDTTRHQDAPGIDPRLIKEQSAPDPFK